MKVNSASPTLQYFCIIIITVFTFSCNDSARVNEKAGNAQLETALVFDRLTGTWQNESDKSFEQWIKNENGTYRAIGFSVQGNDTTWREDALVYKDNENWIFENTVKDQNEGNAVKFISSFVTNSSVQFSNPAHDFPTEINYTILGRDSLYAFIAGPNINGGKDTIPFRFTRLK